MTIDERIEALTHSVELLSLMHTDNERQYAEMFKRMDAGMGQNELIIQRLDASIARLDVTVQRLTDIVRKQ